MKRQPMIEITDLTLRYGEKILTDRISLKIRRGSLTALAGRNGCGKSTFLRACCGLVKPVSGSIEICGKNVFTTDGEERAKTVSFTGTERIRIQDFKCRSVVSLGRYPYTGWSGKLSREDEDIVDRAMELTGMQDFAERKIGDMSDGEFQKIMIARALAQDTPAMIFDEPTAFLDIPGKYETVSILRNLADKEGKTIVFSTHDLDTALSSADTVLILDSGKMTAGNAGEIAEGEYLNKIFGIHCHGRKTL